MTPHEGTTDPKESILRALFHRALEASLLVDDGGLVIGANAPAARLLGCSIKELVGRPLLDVLRSPGGGPAKGGWRGLVDGSGAAEAVLVRRDGQAARAAVRFLECIEPGAHLVLLEPRRVREERLASIGSLVLGTVHDLNNLLVAALGYAELAALGAPPGSAVAAHLEEALRAARRGVALAKQLLAAGRMSAPQRRVLDLNEQVEQCGRLLRRVLREDIALVFELGAKPATIRADPAQIDQLLMNLAANAGDALPLGGRVVVATATAAPAEGEAPGRRAVLSISDSGCGMDPETLHRIFDPFFTTKEPGKGVGLGLSTVRMIVREHGGEIRVRSRPGEGTTFETFFPLVEEPVDSGSAQEAPRAARGRGETVLVVEDEEMVRRLVADILREQGYRVLEADGPAAAVRLAAAHGGPVDLLLTDVIMPETSGTELHRRITTSHPQTKVLFVSGYTDEIIARHGIFASDCHFLQKPFTLQELTSKVREVLGA